MSSSWAGHGPSAPNQPSSSADTKMKKPAARQLLSCTKCRERKVKCDRTKPCSACCARGHPKECEFVVGEGNDYSPIPQAYEIRKLRAENQRLRERLQANRQSHSGDEGEEGDGEKGTRSGSRASATRQRRFKTGSQIDNLYFGSPGLATILSEFETLHIGSGHSLTHPMPKGRDMYAPEPMSYPFQMVANFSTTTTLLKLLPDREELFDCLDLFQRRAQSCSFPNMPDEITRRGVEQFLSDREHNAELYPDMLALIFVTLATGLQMGQFDRSGGEWVQADIEATSRKSDVYITASMQALRIASFMNRPTLLGIQTLVMMGPYLTNSGRFLDAWTLFGTTIRLAHSIGLHRLPSLLDPTPSLRECTIRQTLWWWMLHMDQQYSVTLGRPLGISGIGDCPPPEMLTTNTTMLRLNSFVDHFTILARQILSSSEMMSVPKIDEFTNRLIGLWDTMPEALQFNESWLQLSTQLPEWPLEVMSATLYAKVQSFLILLNRQRIDRGASEGSPPAGSSVHEMHPDSRSHRAPLFGRSLVIHSSFHLLQTFMFFYHRNQAVLKCWTMGQQAFNAAMILLLDAWETENEHHMWIVNQAYAVFVKLYENGVHKLAKLAVERIWVGLEQLERRRVERTMSGRSGNQPPPRQQQQQQQHQPPHLSPDTSPMMDLSGDTVMGSTGMFLLEDPGLQTSAAQYCPFRPLAWNMATGSAHPSNPSNPPTPNVPSPTIPVSQITAAPFPVMSTAPVLSSPFAIGLQPRMAASRRGGAGPSQGWYNAPSGEDVNMALQATLMAGHNTSMPQQQQSPPMLPSQDSHQQRREPRHRQSFSQVRGPRHGHASGSASTGGRSRTHHHRLEKGSRSQQRRK